MKNSILSVLTMILVGVVCTGKLPVHSIAETQDDSAAAEPVSLTEQLRCYPAGYYEHFAHYDVAGLKNSLAGRDLDLLYADHDSVHMTRWLLSFLPRELSEQVESITIALKVKVRPFKVERNDEGEIDIKDPAYIRMTKDRMMVAVTIMDVKDEEYMFVNAGDPLIVVRMADAAKAVADALAAEVITATGESIGNLPVYHCPGTEGGEYRFIMTPEDELLFAETNELLQGMYDAWAGTVSPLISEYEYAQLAEVEEYVGPLWNMRVTTGVRKAILRWMENMGEDRAEIDRMEEQVKTGLHCMLNTFNFVDGLGYHKFDFHGDEDSAAKRRQNYSAHPERFLRVFDAVRAGDEREDFDRFIAGISKKYSCVRDKEIVHTSITLDSRDLEELDKLIALRKKMEAGQKDETR